MSVTATNLVMGAARLSIATFGATEPEDSVVSGGWQNAEPDLPWVDVGGTDGGVVLEVDETLQDLQVDQITLPVGARTTESKIQVTAKLSEMTLDNFNWAINQIGIMGDPGDGYQSMEVPVGVTSTQPAYSALMIDGWAPATESGLVAMRRIIVRKVLSTPKASFSYDKKTQDSYDVTWAVYFISDSVNPLKFIDQQDMAAAA